VFVCSPCDRTGSFLSQAWFDLEGAICLIRTSFRFRLRQKQFVAVRSTLASCSPGDIKFSAPVEFGGLPGLWTPEHFLLSAIASCFVATFEAIANASNFEFVHLDIVTEGIVQKIEDGRLKFSALTVNPTLTIEAEEDRDRAIKLLNKTERLCLIANSLATPVAFASQIVINEASHVLA
jgi:organic hydroperoxide reductase OsmC/OhrA